MSPFDIINNISSSNDQIWETIGDKDYNAFMVNRGLSYYLDCIMHANEMNRRYSIPKYQQYEYYHHAITPKKKRFSKWASSKKDAEIQLISEYFSVSTLKAGSIRKLLTDTDLKDITAKMYKGGTT
jgi:hypothetical protein